MKTESSDVISGLEREATQLGISAIALLDRRAAAQGVSTITLLERLSQAGTKSSAAVRLVESKRQVQQTLEKVFEGMGHSARAARIAAAGRTGRLREASAPTKHEDPAPNFTGGNFERADYGYTPSDDPSTWQLLLTTSPGGKPDPDFVRTAVLAIDPASQSVTTVTIPEADLPDVLASLSRAWKAALPDEELPAILTAEAAVFLRLGVPIKGLSAAARGRSRRF